MDGETHAIASNTTGMHTAASRAFPHVCTNFIRFVFASVTVPLWTSVVPGVRAIAFMSAPSSRRTDNVVRTCDVSPPDGTPIPNGRN